MSLRRGKYGVEWNPRQDEKKQSGLRWVFLVVGLVALVSFSVTIVRRCRARAAADVESNADAVSASAAHGAPAPKAKPAVPPPPPVVIPKAFTEAATEKQRPPRVRNLLARLAEAERRRDVEMAVSTIEQLRTLPGEPAADLESPLSQRLGVLNMKRLFDRKTKLWVKQVEVRRGDSASRIAAEHGSTFASLARLNDGAVDTVRIGQKLYVMDHPRFTLVVRRRARTADLLLKDKFFKRYDLTQEPTGKTGAYELPKGASAFWRSLGVSFKAPDRTEIDLLMPVGSSVFVSEM